MLPLVSNLSTILPINDMTRAPLLLATELPRPSRAGN
jgi:hypothetical protein